MVYRLRVTFDIEVSEKTLTKEYCAEFSQERADLLSTKRVLTFKPDEKGVSLDDETLRLMAWDFVLGRHNHGIDPDKRSMSVEVVVEKRK